MRHRTTAEIGLVVIAVACAVVPWPARFVERVFSTGIYPYIQHGLTGLSNGVSFAIFDVLVLGSVAALLTMVIGAVRRSRRTRRVSPLWSAGGHIAACAAGAYLLFLVLWGFNYQRVAMSERIVLTEGTPSRQRVLDLGLETVRRVNDLHAGAHAAGWNRPEWRDPSLRAAFRRVQLMLADTWPAEAGRLKWTVFGPYFRWTGVDGMVDPYALEVLVNPDLLPWERPFVAAHEWAHLGGYADEAEANFVGWLTCVRADVPAQYSGWLYLFWQISGEVNAQDRDTLSRSLAPGPRRDVNAIIDRLNRGQFPLLRNASWRVYDQYLKANRVDAGIRSYGEVVTLILQARFADGWVPIRRSSSDDGPTRSHQSSP